MMNTIFGFGTFRWARLALLASAATTCVCGSAVAQSVADAPLPDPAADPQDPASSLDIGPGEMLLNPELIPPELRPKFPENVPPQSVMEGSGHPHPETPPHGGDLGGWSTSCGGCEPGYIGRFDALFMTNDSADGVGLSNAFRLDEFDYEWGGRATIGRQFDCINGYEIVGTFMPEWEAVGSRVDGDGKYNTNLFDPVFRDFHSSDDDDPGPEPENRASAFSEANNQSHRYRAEYYSIEANRTYNGWDVAKVLWGLRVINYEEDYRLLSSQGNDLNRPDGLYGQKTQNILVGLQAGLDLHYPLSQRLWGSLRGRGGLFANFAEGDTLLVNDGTTVANNSPDDTDYAGLIELGAGLRYDLGPALSVHGGYEIWYLHNVATASDQLRADVTPALGRRLVIDDDVVMHGLTFGARFRF